MKVDFELLLKQKIQDGDLRPAVLEILLKGSWHQSVRENQYAYFHYFPEDNAQFKTIIRKSDNILHCRLKATVDIHWRRRVSMISLEQG